jgi:hypothetical protein
MSELTPEEIERRKRILGQKEPLKVEIDTTQVSEEMEKLIRAKVEAEAKLKSGIEIDIGKDVIEKLKAKADELNIEYEEPKSREDFEALAYIVAKTQAEKGRSPPSGTVPLSPAQMGQELGGEDEFSSYSEMLDFIRDAENSQEKAKQEEAQQILNELWKKALKYQQETNKTLTIEQSEKGLVEEINERFRRRRKI